MNKKEWILYGSAILVLLSGIVLCFICFFLNAYVITGSVLGYFGQTILYAAGIFGVSIYFKEKLGQFKEETLDEITKLVQNSSKEDKIS